MPFDWRNPVGFVIAMSMLYIMFSCIMKIAACVIALAVGSYLYAIADSKCLQRILSAVDQSSQLKAERKHIRKQLVDLMQYHSNVKQLSKLMNKRFFVISFINEDEIIKVYQWANFY